MAALLAALAPLAPGSLARAEESLFVARLAGGVVMLHPDMPAVGGAISGEADYGFSERLGVIASALGVLHGHGDTLGLGLGLRGLLLERQWVRIFLHAGPELLLVWRPDQTVRADFSFRGGLGLEYLFMWGLGLVVELHGSAPMGLGEARILDGAAAVATVGLFMEF